MSEPVVDFPNLAFPNGVTRAIWLAAHQAECFPVECDAQEAPNRSSMPPAPTSLDVDRKTCTASVDRKSKS
uniref:plasmid fertility inhibition factor family protein n=1 Tax=Paraburkholderia terrae TaxID=311230 RepID=UPI003EC0293E